MLLGDELSESYIGIQVKSARYAPSDLLLGLLDILFKGSILHSRLAAESHELFHIYDSLG